MNIKKQIRNIYFYEAITGFQINDAIWVFFLLEREFSMVEVGVAESVFHLVSMCCEVPSGMVSDLLGRRKTLIWAGIVSAISCICMIMTDYFAGILVAMSFNALSYNLISGTREALTYDSLLESKEAERYLQVSSRQEMIYSGCNGAAGLFSVVTVTLGYRIAYRLGALKDLCSAFVASRLREPEIGKVKKDGCLTMNKIRITLLEHFQKSISFMMNHEIVRRRMFLIGLIGSGSYIVTMLLQEHLIHYGLPKYLIGLPMLFLSLADMAGAVLAEKTGKVRFGKFVLAAGCGTGIMAALAGNHQVFFSVLAAAGAGCFSQAAIIRLGNENQKAFSSEIRATMVSVESMTYSICMMILTPLVSLIGEYIGNTGGMAVLGGMVITGVICIVNKRI